MASADDLEDPEQFTDECEMRRLAPLRLACELVCPSHLSLYLCIYIYICMYVYIYIICICSHFCSPFGWPCHKGFPELACSSLCFS